MPFTSFGGFGVYRVQFFGPLPITLGFEAQYYPVRPDAFGPKWNFRFMLIPIIPSLF